MSVLQRQIYNKGKIRMVLIRDVSEGITISPRRGGFRSYVAAALFLVTASLLASSAAHAGDLDKIVSYDIAAQTLDKALLQFGAQAHVQIMFACDPSMVRLPTHELKGSYTGKRALAEILAGTRLTYIEQGHTLEILPQASADPSPAARASRSPDAQRPADPPNSSHPVPKSLDPPATDQRSQGGQSPPLIREIIVTAEKYRQPAFDVPLSLDVIGGQELQRLNITSLNDLQYDVAGLYVQGGDVYNYIVLRGVSNLSGNGSLVGEYIDEADISADGYAGQVGYGAGDVQLYDLERVEVLKGPQGTLYGDGAMGGVIRYITNKPAADRYEMSADVSASFTQYGAPSQRTEAMLNTPLIADSLALRIAGQFEHDGGWVDEPAASLKNINDLNLTDVRIEGLWQPIARFNVLATQVIHREAYGIGGGEDAQGNISQVYGVTAPPNGEQSLNLSNVTVTADLAKAQLLSSSTYLKHTEADYNQSFILSGEFELEPYFPVANETLSEELRLHGTSSGPWQWMLGGFYKRYRDSTAAYAYFGPPGPLSTASYYALKGASEQSTSEAAFADTSLKLLDRLTLGVGVRYYKNRFSEVQQAGFLNNVLAFSPQSAEERFTSTDPRVYLRYRLTSQVNTYASAAKGFRSGEPDLGLLKGFNPESLWSYDLGVKMRFLQSRVQSDVDVFYEEYSDFVGEGLVTAYGIPTFGTFNIGDARIKGLDADVAWWLSDRWRVSTKAEAVDSKFVSITAGDTGFVPGERLPLVPSYTFAGALEREFHWANKPGFAQVNYSQTARVRGVSSPVTESDVIRFLSFKTGVRWNRNLRLEFFAQNLLNDRGYLDPYWNEAAANRPRPRTFGIDFSVNFE